MNFRLTMVLVIVLLVILGLWAKFHGAATVETPEDTPTKNALLTPQPKDVSTITFTQDGQKQVAFAHKGTEWLMTFPVTAPANTYDVSNIADTLKSLTYKDKFEPGSASGVHSPESTGTDKPRNVVTFADDAGKEHTLSLGKTTVGGVYATMDAGKTIYLLAANPIEKLDVDPQTFRNKSIKETPAEKIVGLTIRHTDQTVSLLKRDGKWMIDSPIPARANATAVEDVVNELKSIRASAFSDFGKNMPATGLKNPIATVTATVEEKAPVPATTSPATATSQPGSTTTTFTLDLGYFTDLVNKKNVYAGMAGSNDVFTISSDTFNKLNKELKDLRDPAISPLALNDATHASISHADGPATELAKNNGEWTVTTAGPTPQTLPADSGSVSGLLSDLRTLRAIKFVDNAGDLKSIGLDPPQTKVDITLPGQSQHEVLFIGKPENADAVTPMMRQGEPTVYLVQTPEVEKLGMTALALRDRTVDRITANDIQRIDISGPQATGGGIVLERDGAAWKLISNGKTDKADDTKVTSLLADFSPLTAVKYVGDGETVSGKADIEVKVTANQAPATTHPSTMPSTAPAVMGPTIKTTLVRTLRLYRIAGAWRGLWDGQPVPQWTFEPTAGVVEHLMTAMYAATPTAK